MSPRRSPIDRMRELAVTAPADGGLFPAPAPPGLTPADLDVPDDGWRASARSRRSS